MGAITIRVTDEIQAFVEDEAESLGYPDAEAFVQAMLMDSHSRKLARLHQLLDEGLASGVSGKSIDQIFDEAVQRHRARQG